MQMPQVNACSVTKCFYNKEEKCHANAITVGSPCPKCDTYVETREHQTPAEIGLVGACHESDCKFNKLLSCQAPGINVGFHMDHADCETYSPK